MLLNIFNAQYSSHNEELYAAQNISNATVEKLAQTQV